MMGSSFPRTVGCGVKSDGRRISAEEKSGGRGAPAFWCFIEWAKGTGTTAHRSGVRTSADAFHAIPARRRSATDAAATRRPLTCSTNTLRTAACPSRSAARLRTSRTESESGMFLTVYHKHYSSGKHKDSFFIKSGIS